MASFVFGKSVDFLFAPNIDGNATSADSLVSARIYTDYPTESQIENTDIGHIEEVLSWTDNLDNTYTVTFAPLVDADQHSNEPYEVYYVVLNFKYEATASAVFDVASIKVYRPNSWTEKISVLYTDVIDVENKLATAFADADATISAHIEDAKEDILQYFQGIGFDKVKLVDLDKLNLATKYRATEYACRNASSEDGQFWFEKADFYSTKYTEILKITDIGVLPAHDSDIDEAGKTNTNTIYIQR